MAGTKQTAADLYRQAEQAQKKLTELEKQQPAAYQSSYGAKIDALMAQLDSRPSFRYDANGDPLFRQYQQQYQRQGKAAMADTLGAASTLTGGYGSSYAATAASQAYQDYLSKIQDVIPALYQTAYSRYQDEGAALEKQLQRLQGLEAGAQSAWQAQQSAHADARAEALDAWRYLSDAAYKARQDELAQQNWQKQFNAKYGAASAPSPVRSAGSTKKPAASIPQKVGTGILTSIAGKKAGATRPIGLRL